MAHLVRRYGSNVAGEYKNSLLLQGRTKFADELVAFISVVELRST